MNYIMQIIKSLEKSGVLITAVGKTITNEEKETKGWISEHALSCIRR